MILAHAQPKTGHPNCRRPDKVIDAGQIDAGQAALIYAGSLNITIRFAIGYHTLYGGS